MKLLRFFAHRRFNIIDGLGLSWFGAYWNAGEHWQAVSILILALIVSCYIELKTERRA